jgi:hypothetical protein
LGSGGRRKNEYRQDGQGSDICKEGVLHRLSFLWARPGVRRYYSAFRGVIERELGPV